MNKHPFDDFGINVFDENTMKERLPHPIYNKWKTATKKEDALDRHTADAIAHAMKTWAIEKGATHFSHWFHPMTGSTAEKHDSFVEPNEFNQMISRFSGKALIKGEGDASSFPSGGLRATFEARGYTYWDCTSPAFVRDNVLCIPTIFVSYNGETLDKKAPLLKSIEAVSNQATRIVNAFKDKDIKQVNVCVGLEQEYFLIDKTLYDKRPDLIHTGKTLFGSNPPKGNTLDNHYYGSIPTRVKEFMKELDVELWKLGIYAKTEHNEAAPCQFEIAPLFADANIAVDQNQIIMDMLKKTSDKHGFTCLLNEKPFDGVNGSGKHNNWSLVTDDGQNLFEPGDRPHENIRFLLFVCAVIKAVDTYPELLRMAASSYDNDYRLGADEAPPAIISICMGSHLEEVLTVLEKGKSLENPLEENVTFSINNLAYVPKDTSDRNRTSPFAFTGNKFEFRMVGSSRSASTTNIVLNTIVADVLSSIANELEPIKYIQEIREKSISICKDILHNHNRILFSKDGYSEDWIKEAESRGLPNIENYYDSISSLIEPKSIEVFTKNKVYQVSELEARAEILYEEYVKTANVQIETLLNITKKYFIPALAKEIKFYADTINSAGSISVFEDKITTLTNALQFIDSEYKQLLNCRNELDKCNSNKNKGEYINLNVKSKLNDLRKGLDLVEEEMSRENYPFPTYEDMFTSVD